METKYETRSILTADANSTVTVRTKSSGNDGELGYLTVLADSAHTIAFYDGDPTTNGTLIFTKPASLGVGTYWFKRPCKKGIYAVVANGYTGNSVVGFI